MKPYALGLDIGGTRMKLGVVRLRDGTIGPVSVVDTCRDSETEFFSRIQQAAEENLARAGVALDQLEGVGVSVGTYVFSDGCID